MSWHYQLRHRVMPNGEHYYDVVEAFTDPTGWTEDGMGASGETPAEVSKDLHRMLKDIASHGILEDTSCPQPEQEGQPCEPLRQALTTERPRAGAEGGAMSKPLELEARALVVDLSKTLLVKGSGISEHAIDMVRDSLAARERAVWDEIIERLQQRACLYVGAMPDSKGEALYAENLHNLEWCRLSRR